MGIHNLITRQLRSLHQSNLIPDTILRKRITSSLSIWLGDACKPSFDRQLSDQLSYVRSLERTPIAAASGKTNSQHYELPTEFFLLVLGKQMKYSCSYFADDSTNLDDAEEATLRLYCERAQIKDGHTILDLGCGWGSLCLYIAQRYKKCKITGICYSTTQKEYIEQICRDQMLNNVEIIHADIGTYKMEATFDRIFSIEMFEYMRNYKELLHKISKWMKDDSLLFIEHCCHKSFSHYFEGTNEKNDISLFDSHAHEWFERYFFTGGSFPSASLLLYFQENVSVKDHWIVNGKHFSKTSKEWLKRMDKNSSDIKPIIQSIYGKNLTVKWTSYWRSFFIFVDELFGYKNGEEWMIAHFLFKKK